MGGDDALYGVAYFAACAVFIGIVIVLVAVCQV